MSIVCLSHVMRHSEATLGARLVLFVLAEHAHDDGSDAYPAVETIAERTRMSRKGVQGALRRLEADGAIAAEGVGPKGQTKYRVVMKGGEATSPVGGRTSSSAGANGVPAGGVARSPEPSKEPSEPGEAGSARTDKAATLPEDFPEELRPHARAVYRVLVAVASQHDAREVKPLALGRVIMARPRKPLVRSAHDFAAWAADPPRPIRDVVASYRRWLDNERDLQTTERLREADGGGDDEQPRKRFTRED